VATHFHFEHSVPFSPENPVESEAILRAIPAEPGIFALRGHDASAQPYLTRTADLRRRARRLLAPPDSQSKRLNLRDKVARIDYTVTGSEFESTLTLYHAASALFGYPEARRRLKLTTPFFLRFTAENDYPRVYSTNRLSKRALAHLYGPFPSRAAADRYCDAVLDLFKLRRCYEDLAPHPTHPGCVYQEMHKCLAPCNQAVTPEGAAAYAAESKAVEAFFDTHGESLLAQIAADRDQASADLDFERAAALHTQHQKVKAAAALADELVQTIPNLRAVIVQRFAQKSPNPSQPEAEPTRILDSANTDQAAIFLLNAGCLTGPEPLSTLGVRAVKEQTSVGSSLFAQPLMLQAVPLAAPGTAAEPAAQTASDSPELRATAVLAQLADRIPYTPSDPPDIALLSDHLSLLRRWYYRPEKQRQGEIFLPNPDTTPNTSTEPNWPIRRILRGAARMALGDPTPMAETNREAAKSAAKTQKVKILHQGRPDVERTVPVYQPPPETNPEAAEPAEPETFTSRRSK
jgi:excinuclease ABC subunit C